MPHDDPNTDQEIELIAGDASDLAMRVAMRWQRDRFEHAIGVIQRGMLTPVLATIDRADGQDDPLWPSNGALQQMSRHQVGDHFALLGLGSAGRSHWSVSVESYCSDASNFGLRFDFACRCRETPRWLGNRYQGHDALSVSTLNAPADRAHSVNSCINWQIDRHRLRLAPDDNVTEIQWMPEKRELIVRRPPQQVSGEITLRWAYRIELTPG